jgi:hypothetical protein
MLKRIEAQRIPERFRHCKRNYLGIQSTTGAAGTSFCENCICHLLIFRQLNVVGLVIPPPEFPLFPEVKLIVKDRLVFYHWGHS